MNPHGIQAKKIQLKALASAQRWEEARELCTAMCRVHRRDAEAWYLLGSIHGQLQAFSEAERCTTKAIALRSNVPFWHFNLGLAQQKQGKLKVACRSFERAISLNSGFAEAFGELAFTYQLRGKGGLEKAVEHYRSALALKPDDANVHFNLATALRDLCLHDDAIWHFEEALRLQPDMVRAYTQYGLLLQGLSLIEQAEELFRKAAQRLPENPAILTLYGYSLKESGDFRQAKAVLQQVLELQPDEEDAVACLAQICEIEGDAVAALQLLRPLVRRQSRSVQVALGFAALAGDLALRDQAIIHLEGLVQGEMSSDEREPLLFALGKLYDKAGRFDDAFRCFHDANESIAERHSGDINETDFSELVDVFSKDRIQRRPRSTINSSLPVFIVGMPRSGTTLVEQIVSSHPDVCGAGELPDIANIRDEIPAMLGQNNTWPECVDDMQVRHLDMIADRYLETLSGFAPQAVRVTDKMPHNFVDLGLIDMLFPGAHVIHCTRDPMDTCLSIFNTPMNAMHLYSTSLARLGQYFRRYQRLMIHWNSVLRLPVLDVAYEELVADQEAMTRKIIGFCGLRWDERCLRFHESGRLVLTPSYNQVRQSIYAQSIGRWKNYEEHLGPLIEALNHEPGEVRQ